MEKFKYPRTPHSLDSEYKTADDKTLENYDAFEGKEIVILEKMDGESTTFSKDYFHARSLDSTHHPSRDWVKGLWGQIRWDIPVDWRICLENVFATHSLKYDNLDTYAYVLNIWNENNECLSLNDTLEWCKLLNLIHVPILWTGFFDLNKIKEIYNSLDKTKHEGIVVRKINSFHYDDFKDNYFKIVRKNHVNTDSHWMSKPVVPNKLKKNDGFIG